MHKHRLDPHPRHRLYRPPPRVRIIAVVVAILMLVAPAVALGHYRVKPGDTLAEISHRTNVPVRKLMRLNPHIEDRDVIYAGQRIRVHRNARHHRRHHAKPDKPDHDRQRRPSRDGGREPITCNGPLPAAGEWNQHAGYDFAQWAGDINVPGSSDYGNPVRATAAGRVVVVEQWDHSYGWHVKVAKDDRGMNVYAHLSAINVTLGERVDRCELLGRVGSTGNSTGPHLHYEVR